MNFTNTIQIKNMTPDSETITTGSMFHKWINTKGKINWSDPIEVKLLFIEWGDYIKDEYYKYMTEDEN